ncbi:hypothetical protein ACXIT0_12070 [Methylorubrum extorquens]
MTRSDAPYLSDAKENGMVAIRFIDKQGNPTTDYIEGMPVVDVQIHINPDLSNLSPDDTVPFNPVRAVALVDTGANHSLVDDSFVVGHTPLYTVPGVNVGVIVAGDIFRALIAIPGSPRLANHLIGAQPLVAKGAPFNMLLGRSIISDYTLIYDTRNRDFRLEP